MKLKIKDLAELAGVSPTTVSLILNGKGARFSEGTQEKVRYLAKKYHYYPDFYAQNLTTKLNKTIGVILPDLTDFFFEEMLKGIEAVATAAGYSVLLYHSQHSEAKEWEGVELMLSRSVAGLILATPHHLSPERFSQIKALCPVVLMDNQSNERQEGKIYVDERRGMQMAVDYLYQCGHRHIAYIKENKNYYQLFDRFQGYREAMQAHHILDEDLIIETDLSVEGGYAGCQKLLSDDKKFTAAICTNDYMAIGVYRSLFKAGKRIPEDVSIVGFDNIDMAAYITPALTTIHQPIDALGRMAAKALLDKIQQPEAPIANKILEPHLCKRESVIDLTKINL